MIATGRCKATARSNATYDTLWAGTRVIPRYKSVLSLIEAIFIATFFREYLHHHNLPPPKHQFDQPQTITRLLLKSDICEMPTVFGRYFNVRNKYNTTKPVEYHSTKLHFSLRSLTTESLTNQPPRLSFSQPSLTQLSLSQPSLSRPCL